MLFIMLCGQGSAGKSTFGKYLETNFLKEKLKLVRVDEIVKHSKLNSYHIDEYIHQIQLHINYNISLIADFSQDCISTRKMILDKLVIPEDVKIDFITILMLGFAKECISVFYK